MSDKLINEINIKYLVNNSLFDKKETSNFKEDICFYQKRILKLTTDLILDDSSDNEALPFDLMYSFDQYIKSCIHHFKSKDNNDILQEKYNEYHDEFYNENGNENGKQLTYDLGISNNLLMRSFSLSKKTLDSFVLKKKIHPEKKIILPQNTDVDLKNPILKTKGIVSQKNCENKYINNINEIQENKEHEIKEQHNDVKEKHEDVKEKYDDAKEQQNNEEYAVVKEKPKKSNVKKNNKKKVVVLE
jgi:hypothetical protein